MANIDDFKANLIGGGARANQFRVTITAPTGIAFWTHEGEAIPAV